MTYAEFQAQDTYCREKNTPVGPGCKECPATDKVHCADALRNLAGAFLETRGTSRNDALRRRLEAEYGLTTWNLLALFQGYLEFPK